MINKINCFTFLSSLFFLNIGIAHDQLSDGDICRLVIATSLNTEPITLTVNQRSIDYHVGYIHEDSFTKVQRAHSFKCLVKKNAEHKSVVWGAPSRSYQQLENSLIIHYEFLENEVEKRLKFRMVRGGNENEAKIAEVSVSEFLNNKRLKYYYTDFK